MSIAVINNGNMGSSLAELSRKAHHTVTVPTRRRDQLVAQALDGAKFVILAIPYAAGLGLAQHTEVQERMPGKNVVDISRPLAVDDVSPTIGHTASAGEESAQRWHGTRVVKAHTIVADVLRQRVDGVEVPTTVLVAGEDGASKDVVTHLVQEFGFDTADAGPLSSARYLEPVTEPLLRMAYGKGLGTQIGVTLARAA